MDGVEVRVAVAGVRHGEVEAVEAEEEGRSAFDLELAGEEGEDLRGDFWVGGAEGAEAGEGGVGRDIGEGGCGCGSRRGRWRGRLRGVLARKVDV